MSNPQENLLVSSSSSSSSSSMAPPPTPSPFSGKISYSEPEYEYLFFDILKPSSSSDRSLLEGNSTSEQQEVQHEKQEEPPKARGLGWLKHFTPANELKLFEDPWTIKKTLKASDCNGLCRLMLGKEAVKSILPYFDAETIEKVDTSDGVKVKVWDYDSGTEHVLTFKRWASNGCSVFGTNWSKDFVRRRQLREGDEVGLFWDTAESRIGFRVLCRRPPDQPQPPPPPPPPRATSALREFVFEVLDPNTDA